MFPRKINDNLWILGNPYFHIYLIKGSKKCALFEVGISATVESTVMQINALTLKPDYLIVSHPHSDHITGLDDLKKTFPAAEIIVGQGAESFVNHPQWASSMVTEDQYMLTAMACRGFSTRTEPITAPPSLVGCRVVKNHDELDLGALNIRFIEARGHSPGNILVYMPAMQTLLVSDSLGNYYSSGRFFPTFFTGWKDYLATIEMLENTSPRQLGLAHNGFFETEREIENIFGNARQAVHDIQNFIIRSAGQDMDIARKLFDFYYTDELTIYSPQNIMNCCHLLIKRVKNG